MKSNSSLIQRKKRGFTLIELLVFMGVFSLVVLVLTDILSAITQTRVKSEQTSVVQQDGNFITNRLSYDIAQATAISTPNSPGASGSTLTMTVNGSTYTYSLNDGALELTINGSANQLNHTDSTISDLSFTRRGNGDGKDTITYQFTITSSAVAKDGQESQIFGTTVGMK